MCGIAGFQGDFDPAILSDMSRMLASRGPDHQAHVFDVTNRTGLVHTRLSIIDLSSFSNQPLWHSTGRYCIVFNGEIYNFRELRQQLQTRGHTFKTTGDGEVILNLFVDSGIEGLRQLNGIFAFAIYDIESGDVFVARDLFGVKPLYYSITDVGIIFGSEIKALLCSPHVSRTVDETALWQYLTFLWAPCPGTPLRSVRKLEPGHYLRLNGGRVVSSGAFAQYPAFSPVSALPVAQVVEQTRALLEQAVQRQLVADVPVGAFLSGGVDSSAICHFASQTLDRKLQCFTIELQGAEQEDMADDLIHAKQMAKHLGVPLEVFQVTPDIVHDLPRMLFALDEPQADPAPINSMYIATRAREMNIKVLLSGAGGDDIFSGYRRHYALLQESLWAWLPVSVRSAMAQGSAMLPQQSTLMRRFSKAFSYADLNAQQRLISYFFWIRPEQSLALFTPDIRQKLQRDRLCEPLRNSLSNNASASSPLNKMLYLEQKYFLVDHNFNYTDKTSMASGVEVRVPFLDPDLVGFANSLPADLKYRGREGKWILKESLNGILPDAILKRKKTGFGAPLRAWLRGPLKSLVDDILSESSVKRRGIFDFSAISALVKADRENKIDAAYTIFSLICIEIWARQYLDQLIPSASI